MNLLIFYVLAIIAAGSAIMVITVKNIFHSALFLVLTFFSVAGIYVLLNAEFLAAVQVLIYVGAITILVIFAIMLTHQLFSRSLRQVNEQVIPAPLITLIFFVLSLLTLVKTAWPLGGGQLPQDRIFVIGRLLVSEYAIPFEVV